jgi:hypothetical protein
MPDETRQTDFVTYFCKHVVSLGWYEGKTNSKGDFTSEPEYHGASAFILFVGDLPCLVTAGHVLTDRTEGQEKGIDAKQMSIIDGWATNSPERIPFDFFDAPALCDYNQETGIDAAVIALPDNTWQLLSKTTTPFTRENWIHQEGMKFDAYAMVGFPLEFAEQVREKSQGMNSVTTYRPPALISLTEIERPEKIAETTYPRFFGRLAEISREQISQLTGMSGGPIFGFNKNNEGRLQYWPMAIQSGFLENSRIITAGRLATVGKLIDEWLDEFAAQHGNSTVQDYAD